MPHYPKPFFKPSRKTWYVQIGPRQHNLGPDRDEAFRRYHELMAEKPQPPAPTAGDSVLVIIEET